MTNDREILARISRQPNHAAGYKQLVRELGLRGGEDRRQLEERLQKLVDRGELVLMGRDRYALPKAAAKHNLVAGELSVHRFIVTAMDSCARKIPQSETGLKATFTSLLAT
ncbi:MAG: hypothetical protein DMG61_10555 [Acidobacteria bacterium]|nr:MAG: hypothetical protein DMG61_10555 [Acidobacteriota bacterium]